MKKNLILSFASNYSYYELQPFVESWKENASDVECYLFYLDFSEWTKRCLEKMGVKLIEAPQNYKKDITDIIRAVPSIRMRLFNEFLEKNIQEYNSVIICDTRDLIFQNNPFLDGDRTDYLRFSSEGIPVNSPGRNQAWVTKLVGNENWKNQFGDRDVLNGGVYCGSCGEIIEYHKMLLSMTANNNFWGSDQACLSYVVYSGLLKTKNISFSTPDVGEIVSIHFNRDGYDVVNGSIINGYGKVPNVVHQYDRNPALLSFVNSKYRKHYFGDAVDNIDFRSALEIVRMHILRKDYQSALNCLFVLSNREIQYSNFNVLVCIVDNILQHCSLCEDRNIVLFIWHLVWGHAVGMFSKMSIKEKNSFLDTYMSFISDNNFISKIEIEEFTKYIWELMKYYVKENDLLNAYGLIEKMGWSLKKIGHEFYLLSSEVCRRLNYIDESIYRYSIACNLQHNSICYLETYFQSYVFIKNGSLYHVHVGNLNEIAMEDIVNFNPLYIMRSEQGSVMFIFVRGYITYVQSIQKTGKVSLGNEPRFFEYDYVADDMVSIKVGNGGFLSAGSDGNIGLAKWAKGWENFKMIQCDLPKLYYRINRN